MKMCLLLALFQWAFFFVIESVLIVLGWFVVPVALVFSRESPSGRVLTWSGWGLIRLPWWAWPWDNKRDGAMGDIRGDYWILDYPDWINFLPKAVIGYFKMYWWLAFRNPVNNLRFIPLFGCNTAKMHIRYIGDYFVATKPGGEGWQFVYANRWLYYFGFFLVKRIWRSYRLEIRLGFKVEPRHNDDDYHTDLEKSWKGTTFRLRIRNYGDEAVSGELATG